MDTAREKNVGHEYDPECDVSKSHEKDGRTRVEGMMSGVDDGAVAVTTSHASDGGAECYAVS